MKQQDRIGRAAQKAKATLRKHVKELSGHALEESRYNAHGHVQGKQGRNGHLMPKSNAHLQSGARLPQIIEEGFGADDASTRDYGIVDKGD